MIRRNIIIVFILLILIQLDLVGSTISQRERVFVHPIFWHGQSYNKRDKCEEIIRQVFINSGQFEYLGNKEYNKVLKKYPEYFNCIKLYCVYEIAYHLNADYLAVVYIDEIYNNYNVRIRIFDSDSMKVRYLKEFIVQNSDPTLIDSLKSAFYKWNGKKYRPKTEIYDKYYELLWTRWNILQYNFKKHLTNIDVTSDPTNQKPILQNVVKQSEPDTQGIQHSVPQIINRSGPESNESPNILTRKYLFAYNSNAYPLDSICVLLNVKSLQPKNEDIILAPKPIDDFKSLEEAILLAFVDQNRFTNFARKFRSGNFFLYEFHVNTSGEIIFNLSKKYQEYDFSQKILHTINETSFQPALVNNISKNSWIEVTVYFYY